MHDAISILRTWANHRRQRQHKHEAGYLLAIVGSETYPGAAMLSVAAALRMGVGGVIAATPVAVKPLILQSCPEAIVVDRIEAFTAAKKCQAVLLGCGIGRDPDTISFTEEIIKNICLPQLIDADGLWALTQSQFKTTQAARLLTPHASEFHWFGTDLAQVASDWHSTILHKGFPSQIALTSGQVVLNKTGNHAATTAGCGDVLAGICAGLLAQGLHPDDAAIAGVYLAGLSADIWVEQNTLPALQAHEIIENIPLALKRALS